MSGEALAAANRELLAQYASSNVLAAFDFDGTLAPIVDWPEQAAMRPRTHDALAQVGQCFPTVVISGRGHADLSKRLEGVDVFAAIGNHGIEPWRCNDEDRTRVADWGARLQAETGHLEGVWIEDKTYSLSVHYRGAPQVEPAEAEILRAASRLAGARLVGGKRVLNVLPQAAPDKGEALEMARQWLGCDSAIYVGDDDTDEDVFGLETRGRLLTIRVGWSPTSRARLFLPDQAAVDELLETLVALRREGFPDVARPTGFPEPPGPQRPR